ncbi:hypothetical protein FDP56_04645 [Enterococcus casseliflavus]|nr:hypothetical protein [Enterococcus casseliflavus]
MGVFGCYEVSLGIRDVWSSGDHERVDFMTYDTKGDFRCYEIKVSKSDFNSKAKKSFVGDYNYYVLPIALYNELGGKDYFNRYIDNDIGIIAFDAIKPCLRSAKKKRVMFDIRANLMESMMKSMFREQKKLYRELPYWG